MYQPMTTSYHEANERANLANENKVFKYTLLDNEFREIATGFCTNVRREYDPCYDFNWVHFTDIDTNKRHCICQFNLNLQPMGITKR